MAESTDEEAKPAPKDGAAPAPSAEQALTESVAAPQGERRFRSFARSLGRAARWTTVHADFVTQKAVGFAGKVVPLRLGPRDETSLDELCGQLVELTKQHTETPSALAEDPSFWKLLRRLQRKRSQRKIDHEAAASVAADKPAEGAHDSADSKAAKPKKAKPKAAEAKAEAPEVEPAPAPKAET